MAETTDMLRPLCRCVAVSLRGTHGCHAWNWTLELLSPDMKVVIELNNVVVRTEPISVLF